MLWVKAVQHRATRLVPDLQKLPYEKRLRRLQLPTLATGYLAGVWFRLCKVYVPSNILPRVHYQSTTGHALKLEKRPAHHRLRQSFFSQRVTDVWNSLPSIAINAHICECIQEPFRQPLEDTTALPVWLLSSVCGWSYADDRKTSHPRIPRAVNRRSNLKNWSI